MGECLDSALKRGMHCDVFDELAPIPDGRRIVPKTLEHLMAAPGTGCSVGCRMSDGLPCNFLFAAPELLYA